MHRHEPRLHQGHCQQLARPQPSPSTSSMPSRSSMTLSTRCAGPNAKSTTSWRALAISGSAIRSTCPTDSEPHSKTSRYAISRPHVHTASGWRSRNSMTNPLLTRRRSSSSKRDLWGNPQPAAANHRCRAHCQAPLERHPALVPQQDSQWPHRGDQQPRPSRQSKGSRLPLSPQPQSHGLPATQPNSISCFQTEIVATHAKQRRTKIIVLITARSFHPLLKSALWRIPPTQQADDHRLTGFHNDVQ